uniref:Uncharacterized protein n=1 Tax=Lepeophtheirus salmonis TaxID=72036 RepID=A0A0K2TP83_LEPSM
MDRFLLKEGIHSTLV